jgi:methyl-accepting chemotaxis protein
MTSFAMKSSTMQPGRSVSRKILGAFGVVFLVFGVAIALSVVRLAQFNDAASNVTEEQLPKFEVTNAWASGMMQEAIHMRNVLVVDDPERLATEVATIKQFSLKSQDYLDTLKLIARSDEERARVQDVMAARGAFQPLEIEFLQNVAGGDLKSAREILLTRIRSPQLAYLGKLTKLSDFFKTELTRGADALDGTYTKTRKFVLSLAAAAIGIALLLAVVIARSIAKPLKQAVGVLAAIEQGNYESLVKVETRDETGRVLGALDQMQRTLKARIETDRVAAQENVRIRTALDRVSVGVMLADNDGKIIYANDFARQIFRGHAAQIRTALPQFDPERIVGESFDIFHRNAAHQRGMLAKLKGNHTVQIQLGRATLRISANPVDDAQGKRLGTVVQWHDRTQEVLTEEEVKEMVKRAVGGDLTARIESRGKEGFFQVLAEGMNELTGKMADVVRSMSAAAAEVRTGADEISRGNLNLSQRTEEQASSLEETASSMEQMTSAVKNNADNAAQANQLAAAARDQAERGGKVVGAAVSAMSEINTASKKIADIIGVIDEIAFQTNLLALNAAVEAARAGEQGRGFAVVASEVRNLASRSAQAAKEIKALIQDSVGKVTEGTKLVDESGRVLAEIVTGVKKVTDVVAEIAASSREQAAGIEQVNKAVTSMDAVTQQNAALVEQASAAAQALTEQARNLSQLIEDYRVDDGADGPARMSPAGSVVEPRPVAAKRTAARLPALERRSAARPWNDKSARGATGAGSAPAAAQRTAMRTASEPARTAAPAGSDQDWQDF